MEIGTVRLTKIEDEMRESYLDYAMSVIVSRALPDVRDGLKPVQRRIVYTMDEMGLRHTAARKKSAGVVGDVMGHYHPHGDAPVYDTMVRLAQDFSMRYPLVDGQGNFGSVDNDPPAAMRYTEARLTEIAEEMLADIDKDTVDFEPNYDGSRRQPKVLPTRIPSLLLNGSSGIAVGMATNIPPHNLNELCDGLIHLIDNPEATVEDLLQFVQGPDFPTAATILGREGIRSAYSTGHGRIIQRARAYIEELPKGGRFQILVTELPYQVNKAALIERIADLVKDKKLDGISDLRDESDRSGMRIVIELKREAQPRAVLNNLYKHTAMQQSFSANMLALVDGAPRVLNLKQALVHFLTFRQEVTTRRLRFELARARERAHILEGLKVALDNLDRVIALIRQSPSTAQARNNLMTEFQLTQVQSQAIVDMRLGQLAALERKKILDELAELLKEINRLEDLLANPRKILALVRDDLKAIKTKYGDARRTRIVDDEAQGFTDEDLIPDEEVVVTLSSRGYIKRLPIDTYRTQRRGGRGITGMVTREQDAVQHLLVCRTHDNVLFFTERGKVFQLKGHEIPDFNRTAKGTPIINLIAIEPNELITAVIAVRTFDPGDFLIMGTRQGEVKKTGLEEFASVRSNGLIAMDLEDGDDLCWAKRAKKGDDILMITSKGQAIRFSEKDLRHASRQSGGVRGIRLDAEDRVISMDIVLPDGQLLVVTERGYGKRTPLTEYPTHGRGGGGVITFKCIPRTGQVAAARVVGEHEDVLLISADGIVIRTRVDDISSQGRSTQGVQIMRVADGDAVASITGVNGNGSGADMGVYLLSATSD